MPPRPSKDTISNRSILAPAVSSARTTARWSSNSCYAATVSETTQGVSGSPGPDGDRWTLVVVGPSDLRTHALARGASVVIGRDAECDVRIDHPSISRRHTRIVIGPTC